MKTLTLALFIVFLAALILVAGMGARRPAPSKFELKRRKDAGDATITADELRDEFYQDAVSTLRVLTAVFLVALVLTSVSAFGWLFGSIVAIAAALEYGAVSRLPIIHKLSQKLYDRYELRLLGFIQRHQAIFQWLRSVVANVDEAHIDSKAELQHLVESAGNVLSEDEKSLIIHALNFDTKVVSEIMTPRSVVKTIKKTEMLGPLVLDDLHKTGFSRFPVIDSDIDHVIGVLYLRDLLELDTTRKHTAMAETAMSKKVFYVHENQSLSHALAAFLKTHHHLFIVVNEFRETVGILTLEDTMEALLGKKIVDEFDAHDDLRAVAARNPQANNTSKTATDI